jgi:hypothetical protein
MKVRLDYRFFDVSPRIVPAGATATIEIRPLQDLCRNASYELAYTPIDGYGSQGNWDELVYEAVTPDADGVIRLTTCFECEQEHLIVLKWKRYGQGGDEISDFHIYSLDEDLFARRPYKGDIHIHSARSDGKEDPAYVAGACRRIGLDFVAITDHGMYAPSLEAIDAFEDAPIDIKLFPGEEVHLPSTMVHIINFGGSRSVNMRGPEDKAQHDIELQAIIDEVVPLPENVDPASYAECVWAFRNIQDAGGLAMFCHPYWEVFHRYHPGHPLTDHIFDTQLFDAYEVIGGYSADCNSNTLQIARYHAEVAKGKSLPIAGVSDGHGCERDHLVGWYYTTVFAPSDALGDLISSIKDCYSVAMENLPDDRPRPVGPLRLVQYALFLEREIFPMHDELCFEEGRLMIEHAAGDAAASDQLGVLQGRTAALYDRFWATV